jgi:hypothetical protein
MTYHHLSTSISKVVYASKQIPHLLKHHLTNVLSNCFFEIVFIVHYLISSIVEFYLDWRLLEVADIYRHNANFFYNSPQRGTVSFSSDIMYLFKNMVTSTGSYRYKENKNNGG